ncbi:MAG: hypothetical protein PWR27_828 [Petroclostridium sp.]|jgi:glutamate synthase domain-containing protein 3|uniref:GltB/FmdC/FwdC-like GXGXG domain-containing protein n=1 Tax=Petroclostridium xylanilyticum TaxID=1792311 RepID=UPI000B99053C|nr:hypothetical protein [Petroclostridium xylanilyticum]MBZ4644938.1 hypothetical protein [Clostridia bacterium]MDK2810119.1 hypothetical protein [Petroclostridium sp.]
MELVAGLRPYVELNKEIRRIFESDKKIILKDVNGQRYIGDGLHGDGKIKIYGTPGNDLAAYMNGPEIEVFGNGQDALGNTMNSGRVIVHGNCGDTTGYAMRGGEIFIKGNVGYRVGIHMKEYMEAKPVIVIGGKAGDFLGEYMAGGMILLLGLNLEDGEEMVGKFCGTGMHGGVMYIRGEVEPYKLGKEVKAVEPGEEDYKIIRNYVKKYCHYFQRSVDFVMNKPFIKLIAYNKRPYKNLYTAY